MKETIGKLLIIAVLVGCFTAWVFKDMFPMASTGHQHVEVKMTETIRPGD
ncbi:hypothetical protein [Gorillibacterium massiliense]|nr:hypothetical protein [Gorillibacterium massiliense]